MLDRETKNRINSARQILVGKVPDPKSQVDQITNALIYKFMDDMDRESEEIGGKAKFLTDDLKEFSWGRLMSRELSGLQRWDLYTRALDSFSKAAQIPELFRKIFKDAYLPYRDPETLNLFLKEIDYFSYTNSESLGNAFEYLLSIMGSQGDAGQFRTPRHIIDFVVEIVDPKREDKILDPACGTAGFLISAYKHIWRNNSYEYKPEEYIPSFAETNCVKPKSGNYRGNKLNPESKKQLSNNIFGYDISPDMVKLSLVNLYLHGFTTPQIHEYDTLTYEDRWDECFDVILANPPFMTPKGGIRPHKRFQVTANRAEVLFVDYIAEHLNFNGKAGIIVPEGIIFQSGKAYKSLRKLLVENQLLYAVISLPSGVFQPYSGVKTSILLLDKTISKKQDDILFVKVENDGFSLGSQRKVIDKNDLPEVCNFVKEFKKGNYIESANSILVKKSKLAEDGDYNLTMDRYKEAIDYSKVKWPVVKISEICTFEYGSSLPKKKRIDGPYPVMGSNGASGYHNEFLIKGPSIIIGRKGSAGEVVWQEKNCFPIDTTYYVKLNNTDMDLKFLFYILEKSDLKALKGGAGIPGLNRNDVYNKIKIPLPPLEVQKEIVDEIEGYQKIIKGAQEIVDNWKPVFKIDPEWERVKLGDVCEVCRGGSPRPIQKYITKSENGINWVKIGDTKGITKYITSTKEKIIAEGLSKTRLVNDGDFILSNSMSYGKPYIMKTSGAIHDGWLLLRIKSNIIIQDFLFYILGSDFVYESFKLAATGGVVKNLNSDIVRKTKLPIPPLEVQKEIVKKIEEEQEIVESCKRLIKIQQAKIDNKIAEVWGE